MPDRSQIVARLDNDTVPETWIPVFVKEGRDFVRIDIDSIPNHLYATLDGVDGVSESNKPGGVLVGIPNRHDEGQCESIK